MSTLNTFMIYTIQETNSAALEPVTLSELKAHLRTNDDSEDSLLSDFITAARMEFERNTGRIVLTTEFRQFIPSYKQKIWLLKGHIQSIDGVYYYDSNNDTQEIVDFESDIVSIPSLVWLDSLPSDIVSNESGLPVGYVDYTCGYSDADDVPVDIKLAIKLVAAHFYEHRNSHEERELKVVSMGFKSICDKYRTNVISNWS